jgi:hypothetical protein
MLDPDFDCRLDAGGRDPDSHSSTLRRYHQLLWSKCLPDGTHFDLEISGPKPFLVHRSHLGEFRLTSDSITHRYVNRPRIAVLVNDLDAEERLFVEKNAWPVAQCIVFPGNKVDGQATINGARGMNHRIGDRWDLTLECIRRHYEGLESPLSLVLERYRSFFKLFGSFAGYVDFFLLQDLVDEQSRSVRFYLPFDNFASSPFPDELDVYKCYIRGVAQFSKARAERMRRWWSSQADRDA